MRAPPLLLLPPPLPLLLPLLPPLLLLLLLAVGLATSAPRATATGSPAALVALVDIGVAGEAHAVAEGAAAGTVRLTLGLRQRNLAELECQLGNGRSLSVPLCLSRACLGIAIIV
jgi:hypothetical protein